MKYYTQAEVDRYVKNNPDNNHISKIGTWIDCYWGHLYGGGMCSIEGCKQTFSREDDRCLHEIYAHSTDEPLKGCLKNKGEENE